MGLTESNHSKATNTGCTGPSKSRSTPHFPDSRGYQNRPRQASTLPARPTPETSQNQSYQHPRTPLRDPRPIGHDPRPPETDTPYQDGFVQVGRSPSFRPMVTRRSASADSRKRRSDPLLDAKSLKHMTDAVSLNRDASRVSSQTKSSPPITPRFTQRPRPTAIYVADDQPSQLTRTREGRSRDRGAHGSKSSIYQKSESRDRSKGSKESRQHTTHVSTFTMTPHCPESSVPSVDQDIQPERSYRKHRKSRQRSGQRVEYTASDNSQGDPYVCLHYGGTLQNGQKKQMQEVTAWRTDLKEEEPLSPNHQMSQVVIHMNQVTATTLDNYDALNANIESIQVRRNVWFQASRALGNTSEPPIRRKIASKAMRTPSIYETTSGYDNNEFIRWPDVTNKVSSLYMKPEMHVSSPLHTEREIENAYGTEQASSEYQNDCVSLVSGDCTCDVSKTSINNPDTSNYQVSYSKVSDNRDECISDEYIRKIQVDRNDWDYCKDSEKSMTLDSASEIVKMKEVKCLTENEILPPVEFSEGSYMQRSANDKFVNEVSNKENGDDTHNGKMELNFGINNHIEDYTIIEDGSNRSPFYGCRDSDYEIDESVSSAACSSSLSGIVEHSTIDSQECSDIDNISYSNDKIDKKHTIDDINPFVEKSEYTLQHSEVLPSNSPTVLTKNPCGQPSQLSRTLNEKELDEFYRQQFCLISEYLSLKDFPVPKGKQNKSDIYGNVVEHPGRSYQSGTVPGNSHVPTFSQKCLTQSSSLPKPIQCASRSATIDSGNLENMKAFRNRFRSFDLGHFPVLRLPLGNQPRLIDVLRANDTPGSKEQDFISDIKNAENIDEESSDIVSPIDNDNFDINTSNSYSEKPSVSYPECHLPTQHESNVSNDSELASENNSDYDRIRSESFSNVEELPNDDQSQKHLENNENYVSNDGCDIGTIERKCVSSVPDVNVSESITDISPSCNLIYHKSGRKKAVRSLSVDYDGKNDSDRDVREVNAGSKTNTWQAGAFHDNASNRWSNGFSPDELTLRNPQKSNTQTRVRNDKRRAKSDCSSSRPPSDMPSSAIPDLIPPFNKHVRRKHTNRRSVHSIDWDTPVMHLPMNNDAADCSYTCHEQCQDLVTLDCKADLTPDSHTSEEEDSYVDTDQGTLTKQDISNISNQNLSITVTCDDEEEELVNDEENEDDCEEQEEKHEEEQQEKELLEEPHRKNEEVSTLRKSVNRLQSHLVDNETLEAWVEKYNESSQGLQIAKENDGSYRGCIRVHLNLSRPINIVAGTRPPSIYDILQEDRTMEKTLTSFYMPRDAVKAIHITSKTTTREVIIALLRKFKVVDNPQKFALYERTNDTGQPGKAKLRRLGDSECPLVLAINWNAEGLANKRLVLQENDTADIQWEAFSLPELSNFLRILDREEEEYRCQIRDKYALLRRRIGNMLIEHRQGD